MILKEILYKLQIYCLKNNKKLIICYLPTLDDYLNDNKQQLRNKLKKDLIKNNSRYYDLIDDFKKLPYNQIKDLFIKNNIKKYKESAGHYNEEGNKYIAKIIYDKILKDLL